VQKAEDGWVEAANTLLRQLAGGAQTSDSTGSLSQLAFANASGTAPDESSSASDIPAAKAAANQTPDERPNRILTAGDIKTALGGTQKQNLPIAREQAEKLIKDTGRDAAITATLGWFGWLGRATAARNAGQAADAAKAARSAHKAAVDIYLGAGNPAGFGKLVGWGIGPKDAIARTASVTAEECRKMGMTREVAEYWREFYRSAVMHGRGMPSAPERIKLMDRILELVK
jgi:hypothetical protein